MPEIEEGESTNVTMFEIFCQSKVRRRDKTFEDWGRQVDIPHTVIRKMNFFPASDDEVLLLLIEIE